MFGVLGCSADSPSEEANAEGLAQAATGETYSATPRLPITDFATVSSDIGVTSVGSAGSVDVAVDISHSYAGDLVVTLSHDGQTVHLQDRQGGSRHDIRRTFTTTVFAGVDRRGAWRLEVRDAAANDTGTLNRWALSFAPAPPPPPVVVNEEAFDSSSCIGTPIREAQLVALVGAGNAGAFIGSNTPLLRRGRSCNAATGCGAWSPAVIASSSLRPQVPFIMKGALRVEGEHRFAFSLVDAAARSATADSQCALLPGMATVDCTRTLAGPSRGWFFCTDAECPQLFGTFEATVTDHCARFHGLGKDGGPVDGSPTSEWAALIRY